MFAPVAVILRLNVVVLIVVGSIASLNVAVTVAAVETLVAPSTGTITTMRGGVTSAVVTVEAGLSGDGSDKSPAVQFAETVYLYVVFSAKPVSVNENVLDSPTFVPFLKML